MEAAINDHPVLIQFDPNGIPDELKQRRQWFVGNMVRKPDGMLDKPPRTPTGAMGLVDDPSTCVDFESALAAVRSGRFALLGYLFTLDDPYTGIDLDGCCRPNGEIDQRARSIVSALASWTELSVSGTGLHIVVRAKLPPGRREKDDPGKQHSGVALYDSIRWFAMTGVRLAGTPAEIFQRQEQIDALHTELFPEKKKRPSTAHQPTADSNNGTLPDDDALLDLARKAINGARFEQLFDRGDWQEAGYASHSEADLALCSMLAFWAQNNAARVDALFRRSKLFREGKWNRKLGDGTYGSVTVDKAIDQPNMYRANDGLPTGADKGSDGAAGSGESTADDSSENTGGGDDEHRAGAKVEDDWPDPEPPEIELPPVLPITDDLFPQAMRRWATSIAERMSVPLDYIYPALMTTLGAVIGRRIALRPKRNDTSWLVPCNLWGMVVGPAGELKTPTSDHVREPFNRLISDAITAQARAQEQWKEKVQLWEKEKGDKGPKPEEPPLRRYQVTQFTIESLAVIMKKNPNGVLVYRDELVGLLRNMEREGHQSDRAFLMEGWNGNASYTDDTIGRGFINVPVSCVSLFGNLTPSSLAIYLSDVFGKSAKGKRANEDGFPQRIQVALYPDLPTGDPQDLPADHNLLDDACNIFRALDRIDPTTRFDAKTYGYGARAIPAIGFSRAAQEVFDDFLRDLTAKRRANDDEHPVIRAHFAKYPSLLPKIATIHHLVDHVARQAEEQSVSLDATVSARRACKVLASHAKRVYSSIAGSGTQEVDAMLYKKIVAGKLKTGFNARDAQRSSRFFADPDQLKQALARLTEGGIIKPRSAITGSRGPGKTIYEINPKLHKANKPKSREPGEEG